MPTGVYPRARPAIPTLIVCPECRETTTHRVSQGYARIFCSRSCASRYFQRTRHVFPGTEVEIEDLLWRLYWKEWLTTPEIAARYNTDHAVVKRWMRRFGIPRRRGVRRLTCVHDGCREPIQFVRHKTNGAYYGKLCRRHRHEYRLRLNRHYRSSAYERLTEEERWLRKGKETLIRIRKLSRAPSS